MAYADQKQNRSVALGSVALVHAALGAALLSGLAVKFVPKPPEPPVKVYNVRDTPPPPEVLPPPEPRTEILPRETVTPPINVPLVKPLVPSENMITTTAELSPPVPPVPPVRVEPALPVLVPPVTPPPAALSRGLQPRGNQGDWFPQDSYPAAARRAGAEGRVGVSVDVGANGRVTACRVAVPSGNEDLDQATCRLAVRNGRFVPALNAAGEAVPATITLRPVRWRLEQ